MWTPNYWGLALYFITLGLTIVFFRTSDNKDYEETEEDKVIWNTAIENRLMGGKKNGRV